MSQIHIAHLQREQSHVQVSAVLNAVPDEGAGTDFHSGAHSAARFKEKRFSSTRLVFPRVCQFERHYFTGESHRVPNLHLKWPRGYARIELAHIKEKSHVKPF